MGKKKMCKNIELIIIKKYYIMSVYTRVCVVVVSNMLYIPSICVRRRHANATTTLCACVRARCRRPRLLASIDDVLNGYGNYRTRAR